MSKVTADISGDLLSPDDEQDARQWERVDAVLAGMSGDTPSRHAEVRGVVDIGRALQAMDSAIPHPETVRGELAQIASDATKLGESIARHQSLLLRELGAERIEDVIEERLIPISQAASAAARKLPKTTKKTNLAFDRVLTLLVEMWERWTEELPHISHYQGEYVGGTFLDLAAGVLELVEQKERNLRSLARAIRSKVRELREQC